MKQWRLTKNPFLLFLPFLIFFIALVLHYPTDGHYGDESRYLIYAKYMIDGFLPAGEAGFDHLGTGPGYSIVLIPFVAFNIPLIWITILNAFFFYLSIVLLFKAAIHFLSFRSTLIICLFWAIYINSYAYILLIYTEMLTMFLMSALLFCFIKAFDTINSKKYIYLSGFLIGYIALTKVIFGYVLICMLTGVVVLWLFNKKLPNYKKSIAILLIAFATTVPYLMHTYQVTNKVFYWGTFGGNNLYWMTSPDEEEYGSWFSDPGEPNDPAAKSTHLTNFEEIVKEKHEKDFEEIKKYKGVHQDEVYKKIAISNIKKYPVKFIKNCISNTGRLLFNIPYSYKLQTPVTLLRLPFNGALLVLILFCIFPTLKNWNKIIFPIRFMLFFACIYFGGSILGSAETRMFSMIVPILLCWVAYILEKTCRLDLSFDENEEQ